MMCAGFLAVNILQNAEKLSQTMDSAVLVPETAVVTPPWAEFFEQIAIADVAEVGKVAFLRSLDSEAFEEAYETTTLYSLFQKDALVMGEVNLRRAFSKLPMEYREIPLVPLGDMRHRRVEFPHQTFRVLFYDGKRTNFVTWGILDLMNNIFLIAMLVR